MNSQYFSKEQVDSGEFQQLLSFLMSESYGSGNHYNDIHIYPADCGAFIVEWVQLPWSHEYGGKGFQYVDEDQVVMLDRQFPDNHSELCYDEDDYKERLEEFLRGHPYYKQNEFGRWYIEEEVI